MIEGKKELYRNEEGWYFKKETKLKTSNMNFHKDILGANLASLRLYITTAKDFVHNAELRFSITYKIALILTILHLKLCNSYWSFSVMRNT